MASARLRSLYSPTVELIELVGALAVIGAGAWLLSHGQLTVGELLAFLTFLSRLYGPIRGLGSTVTSAYSAAAGAERVIELLDEEPLPADRPGALTLERAARRPGRSSTSRYTYPGADRAGRWRRVLPASGPARWSRSSVPAAPASPRSRGC